MAVSLALIIIVKGIIFAVAVFLTLSIYSDSLRQVTTGGRKIIVWGLSWVAYSTMWAIYFAQLRG